MESTEDQGAARLKKGTELVDDDPTAFFVTGFGAAFFSLMKVISSSDDVAGSCWDGMSFQTLSFSFALSLPFETLDFSTITIWSLNGAMARNNSVNFSSSSWVLVPFARSE